MLSLVLDLVCLLLCILYVVLLVFWDVVQYLFILLELSLESSCKLLHSLSHLEHVFLYFLWVFLFVLFLCVEVYCLRWLIAFLLLSWFKFNQVYGSCVTLYQLTYLSVAWRRTHCFSLVSSCLIFLQQFTLVLTHSLQTYLARSPSVLLSHL